MPAFSHRSLTNLSTCHADLQRLFGEVVKWHDCTVIEGHRNAKAQTDAVAAGTSRARWGESKHNTLPSLAADVVPYPINWESLDRFRTFGGFVLGVASQMGILVRWGGDWDGDWDPTDQTLVDMPHFELVDYRIEDFLPEGAEIA